MEVLQLQQLLAAHSRDTAWSTTPPPTCSLASSTAFDLSALQLQLLLASQQQNVPPNFKAQPEPSSENGLTRSSSLNLPATSRQPFRDLHSQVYGITPPQSSAPSFSKPSSAAPSRSSSSGGGRWASASDQRDVIITEQLALIKNLNDTISKQKQAAVEQDAVRLALEATIMELRRQLASHPSSPSASATGEPEPTSPDESCEYPAEAQVAYYKEHAEHWAHCSSVDRQQLIQVLRTLIASNKRYQQPLPPMCVKPECRCRNCWFLHAQIDETAWAAAWELHMSLR